MFSHTIGGNEKAGKTDRDRQHSAAKFTRACRVGYRPAKPQGYRFLSESQKAPSFGHFRHPRAGALFDRLHFRFIAPLKTAFKAPAQ
jgi:hypothetical protein